MSTGKMRLGEIQEKPGANFQVFSPSKVAQDTFNSPNNA